MKSAKEMHHVMLNFDSTSQEYIVDCIVNYIIAKAECFILSSRAVHFQFNDSFLKEVIFGADINKAQSKVIFDEIKTKVFIKLKELGYDVGHFFNDGNYILFWRS